MRRVRVRPSKPASAMAMVVGIVFVVIGAVVAIPTFGPFGVFWTLVAAAITIFHAVNVFSEHGVATTEIEVDGGDFVERQNETIPFDERLRRLEQLRKDDLITEDEYQQKRKELLETRW